MIESENLTYDDRIGEKQEFAITDDNTADWAIEKIKEREAESFRLVALADVKIENLEQEKDKIKKKCENDTAYLKSKLAQYFETVPHKKTKTQETYKLLSGTLCRKHKPPKLEYDDAALLAYCDKDEDLRDYIKVTRKPAWAEFKKRLIVDNEDVYDETGEYLEFIKAEPQADEFVIK